MKDIEALADEFDQADASIARELIEPTADEAKNGWTAETLTEYVASRQAGAMLAADPHSEHSRIARRPRSQNTDYDPHFWRGR